MQVAGFLMIKPLKYFEVSLNTYIIMLWYKLDDKANEIYWVVL